MMIHNLLQKAECYLEGQIPNKNLADLLCRHAMNINAYAGNEWWEVKLMIVRAKAAKMQGNVVKTQELALRAQEYCKNIPSIETHKNNTFIKLLIVYPAR